MVSVPESAGARCSSRQKSAPHHHLDSPPGQPVPLPAPYGPGPGQGTWKALESRGAHLCVAWLCCVVGQIFQLFPEIPENQISISSWRKQSTSAPGG